MRELDSLPAFRQWLESGPDGPPAACQALDLIGQVELESQPFPECLFLGCQLTPHAAANLIAAGEVGDNVAQILAGVEEVEKVFRSVTDP